MFGAGNDLPLVDQIGVTTQRRSTPCIGGHANAGMRQSFGAHANFDAWRHAGLASVNGGYAQAGQPLPPSAVGQNHGFRHNQIEGGASLTHTDLDRLLASGRSVIAVTHQAEVVVGSIEIFRFATHHLASRFEVLRQTPEKCQVLM